MIFCTSVSADAFETVENKIGINSKLLYNLTMIVLRHLILTHIVLTAFFISWTYAENDTDETKNWVKVEKDVVITEDKDGKSNVKFLSFKQRRDQWGFRLALSGETNEFTTYPVSTLEKVSIESQSIDFGLQLMASYNLPLISVGAGVNLGYLTLQGGAKAMKYGFDVHAYLDGILPDPYIAPYFKLGMGRLSFSNPSVSDVSTFDTEIAMYYSVGAMFLLDWLQKAMAMDGFYDFGIEGSFLFLEYETFPSLESVKADLAGEFKSSTIKCGIHLVF